MLPASSNGKKSVRLVKLPVQRAGGIDMSLWDWRGARSGVRGHLGAATTLATENGKLLIVARSVFSSMEALLSATAAERQMIRHFVKEKHVGHEAAPPMLSPTASASARLAAAEKGQYRRLWKLVRRCLCCCFPQRAAPQELTGEIAWEMRGQAKHCDGPLPCILIFAALAPSCAPRLVDHVRSDAFEQSVSTDPSMKKVIAAELMVLEQAPGGMMSNLLGGFRRKRAVSVLRLTLRCSTREEWEQTAKAAIELLPAGPEASPAASTGGLMPGPLRCFAVEPQAILGVEEEMASSPTSRAESSTSDPAVAKLMAAFRERAARTLARQHDC